MPRVVVTGASRGIGLELCRQLLERGDEVVGTHRDAAGEARLRALGGGLRAVPLDVRREADVEALARALGGDPVDVLVNNAGVMGPAEQTVEAMDYAAWAEVLEVNLMGPLRVVTALREHLRRSDRPRVVTLTSIMGSLSRWSSGWIAYRTSKAAANKLMRLLAHDLAAEGIVACPVHPGWVRTEMGGPDAELPVEESARGIVALLDRLSPDDSGRFLQWDGTELPW